MKKAHLLPLIALAVPFQLHAAPLAPAEVPASAQWTLHADVEAIRASETGKAIFSRIEAEHGAKLRAAQQMFSIHLLNDVNGITLYGDGKPEHAVALIHGAFNRGHLEGIVQGADEYKSDSYAGYKVHTWTDKGTVQHASFASDDLLVFSRQEDLLHTALDTLKANAPATGDPIFTADGGHPVIAGCAQLAGIDLPADAARLIRMARSLRIAASENNGRFAVRVGAETTDAPSADRLRRMLDGVIAFAQAGDVKLDGLDLRTEIAVTPDKPGLSAAVSLPVPEWISLMAKAAAEDAAKKGK